MPRPVQKVQDMEIDEISLVDRSACPPAAVVIAKRADQGEDMDPDFIDESGQPIDFSQVEAGSTFTDDDGNAFEWDGENLNQVPDEAAETDDERELVGVGKSAFFDQPTGRPDPSDDIVARVSQELSKAVSEEDRSQVVSKALGELSKRAEAAEQRAARAESLAKAAEERRLTKEYIAKAAEYNVPGDPEELGPVLMRMSQALPYEDCAVIAKALSAAGEMLYTEVGYDGQAADTDDPMARVDAFLDEQVAKSATPLSKAQAMTEFFDSNPDAYEELRAERIR